MSSSGANNLLQPDGITVGQSTILRRDVLTSAVGTLSGTLRLTYFTAVKSFIANNIRTGTGGIAAAATPTLCRVGIYQVDPLDKSITLIGSIANDTTLWAVSSTEYLSALTTPTPIVMGVRYAVGILCVSALATPSFYGENIVLPAVAARDYRISAAIGGQADLPASLTDAQQGGNAANIYTEILP